MGSPAAFIPRELYDILIISAVVVRFYIVGGVVAFFAQQGGESLHPLGHGETRTHLLGAEGGRIASRDETGAGGRADRGAGVGLGVSYALFGKGVQMGRDGILVTVAPESGAHVLGRDPENVGPFLGRDYDCRCQAYGEKSECI